MLKNFQILIMLASFAGCNFQLEVADSDEFSDISLSSELVDLTFKGEVFVPKTSSFHASLKGQLLYTIGALSGKGISPKLNHFEIPVSYTHLTLPTICSV